MSQTALYEPDVSQLPGPSRARPWARPIWLVEDSSVDAEAIEQAARAVRFGAPIRIFEDGCELLAALSATAKSTNAAQKFYPQLILLDLNLPNLDGREVLLKLKKADAWRNIPVIVLTTSSHPRDIDYCYEVGANAYIAKPLTLEELEEILRAIELFWLRCASLSSK